MPYLWQEHPDKVTCVLFVCRLSSECLGWRGCYLLRAGRVSRQEGQALRGTQGGCIKLPPRGSPSLFLVGQRGPGAGLTVQVLHPGLS